MEQLKYQAELGGVLEGAWKLVSLQVSGSGDPAMATINCLFFHPMTLTFSLARGVQESEVRGQVWTPLPLRTLGNSILGWPQIPFLGAGCREGRA